MLFSRGLYAEAERLADEIVERDPRQPLPYAVRGDLARQRGRLDEAARQYSLAIQMDPRNPTYLKRYEEVLERAQVRTDARGGTHLDADDRRGLSLLVLGIVAVLCAFFLLLSPERAGSLPGGWTVGLASMLFLGGVAAGACLAAGNLLDRLDALAAGRLGPTVALGLVALASFPAAAALYAVLGPPPAGVQRHDDAPPRGGRGGRGPLRLRRDAERGPRADRRHPPVGRQPRVPRRAVRLGRRGLPEAVTPSIGEEPSSPRLTNP